MPEMSGTNSEPSSQGSLEPAIPADIAGSVTYFFKQLRTGSHDAVHELWTRFCPRLQGLARKTLSGYPQRMADAEDAAQSAFISFWQRAEKGEFGEDLDRNNLWNLLGVITIRKALKQVERERTQKRGGGLVRGESDLGRDGSPAGGEFRLDEAVAQLPAHEFDVHCEELLLKLSDELREIALLKLWGWSTPEIAEELQCTERKVQRKLELVRLKWTCLVSE